MGVRGDDRTQRVLIGIGLAVVGLFAILSFVPVGLAGARPDGLFPSGKNIVGPLGALTAEALLGTFGPVAILIPILLLFWSLLSFGFLERTRVVRISTLLAALVLIFPALIGSLGLPTGGASLRWVGSYGAWTASAIAASVGWLGSALILAALLATSVVGTLGLERLAKAGGAVRDGLSALARAMNEAGRWLMRAGKTLRAAWSRFVERQTQRPRRPTFAWSESRQETETAGPEAEPPPERRQSNGARRIKSETAAVLPDPGDPDASELPPLELLSPAPEQEFSVSEEKLDALGKVLVDKLRTFRVEGRIGGRTTGPVVTQFEVVPASGVKVGRIAALADDLALALKAPSVRIIAPIPGKGAVGVEVPNPERKTVYLRELLESSAYRNNRAELPLALGEDVTGQPYVSDLTSMPHLLIAGVTGSGKSVCINSIITSLIYRYTPDRLRLLLVDPKMVELAGYNVLPHLRHTVVTDNSDAASVLKWLVYEMERRYAWLGANGCRNVAEFNRRVTKGATVRPPGSDLLEAIEEPEPLPYIVLIIDELADLMMTVQAEVERPLAFLAQKARATGIHLVVATQRPSVNVITGLIKANFSCRIAFRVASKVDSRTIIDQNGADTLLGNGDMLFLPPGESEPVRIQGTFVSTEDTERLMEWYRIAAEQPVPTGEEEDILESVRERELEEADRSTVREVLEESDPLFRQAAELVIQNQQGSTSLLQRRLKIGYGRAARIVDQLHAAGIVGPPEGSKPREILVTLEDVDRMCADR